MLKIKKVDENSPYAFLVGTEQELQDFDEKSGLRLMKSKHDGSEARFLTIGYVDKVQGIIDQM